MGFTSFVSTIRYKVSNSKPTTGQEDTIYYDSTGMYLWKNGSYVAVDEVLDSKYRYYLTYAKATIALTLVTTIEQVVILQDETNDNSVTLYFYNTKNLNWIIMQ